MSAEPQSDLKLEIAHVLTIDIVAYSTLLIDEQSRFMAALNRIVRQTPTFQAAETAGKLTRLPMGDGMALVFFGDPEAPIQCAMQTAEALKAQPEIAIRMGIHSGPINQIMDVNDRINVAGAGIDMAQRVMDCGDAGHILLSKRVADDLAPYPRWNRHLHDLGQCEVKHGRKIAVFNFYTDAIGNRALPHRFQSAAPAPVPGRKRKFRPAHVLAVLVPALAIALGLLFWSRGPAPPFVAVLQFRDLSGISGQEHFAEGVREGIIDSLDKVPGLRVLGRSSSFPFEERKADPRQVGRKLGVTHILEGSVMRAPGKVVVNAKLVEVATGAQRWSEDYELNEQGALTVRNEIAPEVARALGLSQNAPAAKIPTQNPEANDLYWRGRALLNKRTPDSIEKARALFADAVARDPTFALARVGIADAYMLLGKVGAISGQRAAALAWPEVSAALASDDQLADAYASRGVLLNEFEWNWRAAEADYKRALQLTPHNVSAHHWYARHLAQLGRIKEALREINAAQELEPYWLGVRVTKGKINAVGREYGAAIDSCKRALELDDRFASAYQVLAQAYAHAGRHSEAVEAAKKFVELSDSTGWARLELAYVYILAGRPADADQIVQEVTSGGGPFSPFDMAAIHAARREADQAIVWLSKAIEVRSVDVIWIRVDPRLDNIRTDPRFAELLMRMEPRPGSFAARNNLVVRQQP